MKRKLISYNIVFYLLSAFLMETDAQNSPSSSTRPAATPLPVPAAYVNPTINYIRTWEPLMPTTDPVTATNNARTTQEVVQSTVYKDGLGRPIQTVIKGSSASGKDVVNAQAYDPYGRSPLVYLPFVQTSGNMNDGKFKSNPFSVQKAFLPDPLLNPSGAGETIFYGQNIYDESPSSNVVKKFGPGNSWANEGGKKNSQHLDFVNTIADSVRLWTITADIPITTKTYDAGQLNKSISVDENGYQLIEYTDKSGKTILKKLQTGTGTAAHTGWLCTYFVYDELDMLRFIIPPLAVDKIIPTWSVVSLLPGLCTIYRYDTRGRNIVTKLPGVDSTEMVYDSRNRVVLMRDGNLKAKNQWLVTYYDNLDRPVRAAAYSVVGSTRESVQANVNAAPIGTLPFIPVGNLSDLGFAFYDDNYSFQGAQPALTSDFAKPQKGNNQYEIPNSGISHRAMGKVTGMRVKILGTTQWRTTTIYYNDKGRVLQTISDNIYGGKQTKTYLYDFSGKVLSTYFRHTNPQSAVTPETRILTNLTYNGLGQIAQVSTQLNDVAASTRIVASYTYDELGNVRTKTIPKESQTIEYNLGGQLKSINKVFVNTPGSSSNWFGEDLSFDYGFNINQYDGSIAGVKWKSRGDGISRALGYSYDKANRITASEFSQQNQGSSAWLNDKVDFTSKGISYDGNGNLLTLKQTGLKGIAKATIDSLKYGYIPNTNKLFFVSDKSNDAQSKLGDFKEINNQETQDYDYDSSGNLVLDMNRLSAPKPYNFLNLPDSIIILGKGNIAYTYDADGNKLRKIITDYSGAGTVTKIDYIEGFVYENDSLVYFPQAEGRVRALYAAGKPVALVYDYFLLDHLGNTRMVLTEESGKLSYAATMESAASAKENALFANIDATRSAKPVGYPADGTTSPNDYVAKLNATAGQQKIGPSLVLRVMAGDTIQLGCKAFYKSAAASTSSTPVASMLTSLLQAFATGSGPADGVHGNGTGTGAPITNLTSANYQSIRDKDPSQNLAAMPKAYLNYVLFDEQLNMVDENSGVRQVQGSPDQLQTLATSSMVIKKNGFIYVYTSNESVQDVFFDNIVVAHNPGPLLEETHYYPFGLTMAGISSKALKNPYVENRDNFNGIEQTTELGLNQYEAFYRTLDPQIGRWWQMDPASSNYMGINPYNCNFNNPISFTDPEGDDPFYGLLWWLNTGIGYTLPQLTVTAPRIGVKLIENSAVRYITSGVLQTAVSTVATAKAIKNFYSIENARRNLNDISEWSSGKIDQGIQNVRYRIQTHTTTPELIANSFMENPMTAITGIAGAESWLGIATLEELAYGARGAGNIPNGKFYSVAFEAELPSNLYPGHRRGVHFQASNKVLDDAMKSDAAFAKIMEDLGVEIPRSNKGTILGEAPKGWVWHHHLEPGKMHLVPKSQHPNNPGGIFWRTMHPNWKGGMSLWGNQ
ncbi:DUF6443 domain-containing protein [Chitinophaga sp. 22321]|uniref:HNH endonuclease n=1 Tax=Chitinophaga hostae TaxID=2831022 RepID=A0ABS5IWD7_9BACT|nr:DUF6443 domain-containing protein [Chitinophaga hostae]MBS0027278.1 HNH endonuclease [Chitinophaga hostae]